MTTIDDLAVSVSEMTNDELLERMRQLRGARRVATPIPRQSTKPKKATKNLNALLKGLSPEQMQALLDELEG